ncbi:MAG: D-alanine--D-alanine ligase [Patescibacteria group bacterium]|nr:D-alanine--D-alanine ligase [Patescibacteria group bacterium]
MRIALTFNLRHQKSSLKNEQAIEEAEFDTPETIKGISRALKNLGLDVFLIEANEDGYLKFKKLKRKIDLVFNIAEGISGYDREAQIPAMLEMLKIPYIGSKPLTQAICLNKALTKEILLFHRLPTPKFQLFKKEKEKLKKGLKFPLIVKPNQEGSSKGIFQNSFVKNKKELKTKVKEIIKNFKQPALVEEFLKGREFTVGLIGNQPVEILPPAELNFSALPKNFVPMDSYEVKWLVDNPKSKIETVVCPAKIEENLWQKIKKISLKAKEVLMILDWCRIDLRLDKKGLPNILEINQIPGIIPEPKENSRFPLVARAAGYSFEEMLAKIIKSACQRYHLKFF